MREDRWMGLEESEVSSHCTLGGCGLERDRGPVHRSHLYLSFKEGSSLEMLSGQMSASSLRKLQWGR